MACAISQRGINATFSYAGRVKVPKAQPLPTRVGGFGGPDGLAAFITQQRITHVVDATHPFASQMSRNVLTAARQTGVPAITLTRPAWVPGADDHWQSVTSIEAAVNTLEGPPQRVLLAIGRMHLAAFSEKPQHHYVLRLVDEPTAPPPLFHFTTTVDRGPFTLEGDLTLLKSQWIERIVCKNAGGTGASSKLEAARALGLPVIMIERPALPPRHEVHSVDEVLAWLETSHG